MTSLPNNGSEAWVETIMRRQQILRPKTVRAGFAPGFLWLHKVLIGMIAGLSGVALAAASPQVQVGQLKADSAIIFSSGMAGGRDAQGFVPQELFATSLDGADTIQLTFSGYTHNHFDVSPNRRLIAANRYSRGDTNHDGALNIDDYKSLWIIDMVHRREWPIALGMDAGYGGVAWSPDSKFVYFSSFADQAAPTDPPVQRETRTMDIYRAAITGGPPVALTKGLNALLGQPGTQKWVSDIAVSRDGEWMAMVYIAPQADGTQRLKSRIIVARVDGSAAHFVTDGGSLGAQMRGHFPVGDFDPDFSPDGRSITFARITDVGYVKDPVAFGKTGLLSTHDIYRVNVDGGELRNLSAPNNPEAHAIPSWGDDCKILYTVWSDKKPFTYPEFVNPDGSGVTDVPLPGNASHVQWIPLLGKRPDRC